MKFFLEKKKRRDEKENRSLVQTFIQSHCRMQYLSVLSSDCIKVNSSSVNLRFAVKISQLNILSHPIEKCGKDRR